MTRAPACASRFPGTRRSGPEGSAIARHWSRMFVVLRDRNRADAHGVAAVVLLAIAMLLPGRDAAAEQPAAAPSADIAAGLVAQARAYEHGEGVAKDQRKAALLYCEGARAGDAEAMFSLGWMYANARGVARSDAMAALLFTRAAAAGHVYARQMQRYVG